VNPAVFLSARFRATGTAAEILRGSVAAF